MKTAYPTALLALVSALALAPAAAAAPPGPDGLSEIRLRGIDHALARPGADLGRYARIRLEPVEVSFDKNWQPRQAGSNLRLQPRDRERIRAGMAEVVREAFQRALTEPAKDRPGYTLTDDEGEDVLTLRVAIVDLFVNVPDSDVPGRVRVYTVSTGEATLQAELVDSLSGTVLARLTDRREARNPGGRLELTDRVRNRVEAERVATAWGGILRRYLDTARAAP